MVDTKDIKFNMIENPEVMTPEEWKFFHKCEQIFKGLLKDLKKQNRLKSIAEMPSNSYKIIETSQRFSEAYNMIIPIFSGKGTMEKFVEHNRIFNINERDLPYLFASQLIGTMITSSESFRNNLLTILKMEDGFYDTMGLGTLLHRLEEVSPIYGKQLNDEIDSNLRNALVHGTFWVNGNHVYYCKDMKLINPKMIPLHKLMIEMKNANILNVCLFNLMVINATKGFFK